MNEKVIKALTKVFSNESLQEEIFGKEHHSTDDFYELILKYSDESFTKEELELTLSEMFVFLFENYDISSIISENNLKNVAGGINLKKTTAGSLAVLTLMGAIPTGVKNFDFSPKVSAWEDEPMTKKDFNKFKKEFHETLNEFPQIAMAVSKGLEAITTSNPQEVYEKTKELTEEVKHGILEGIKAKVSPAVWVTTAILSIPLIYKGFKWAYKPFVEDFIMPSYRYLKKTFLYNKLRLEKDPVKFREIAEKFLKENVFAQDRAMEKIIQSISGHIDMWRESDETGKPCTSACAMAFIGDSGTGKTYTARLLSQLLFAEDMQPWQFITATSVKAPPPPSKAPKVTLNFNSFGQKKSAKDSDKTEEVSPADQLFNEKAEIVHQLEKNNRVIIVLDEIDKIHKIDSQDTILERLRDAKDTGKLRVRLANGEYKDIDVSRTIFICVSNEFRECWGLPKKQLTPAEAAARTTVERDKSLVNRFNVIEFENFKKDDYMTILTPLISQMKESYAKLYNMDIEFSHNFAEDIGQAAEDRNKGVRGLNDFLIELRGALVNCRSKNKIGSKSAKWKAIVKYDKFNDMFSAEAEKVGS